MTLPRSVAKVVGGCDGSWLDGDTFVGFGGAASERLAEGLADGVACGTRPVFSLEFAVLRELVDLLLLILEWNDGK
jgi:hypothetical protein